MTELEFLDSLIENEKDDVKHSLLRTIKLKVEAVDEAQQYVDSDEKFQTLESLHRRVTGMLRQNIEDARWVIDEVCKTCNIEERGRWLYAPNGRGRCDVADEIKDYFEKSGDKVKLKKELADVKAENEVLKKLVKGEN